MPKTVLICDNCGAILQETEQKDIFECPSCKSKYKVTDQIVNNNVNNNSTLVKNYYGVAAVTEKQEDRINKYYSFVLQEMNYGNYSSARNLCSKILQLNPDSESAEILRIYINILKGDNGRYRTPGNCLFVINFIGEILKKGSIYDKKEFLIAMTNELQKCKSEFIFNEIDHAEKFEDSMVGQYYKDIIAAVIDHIDDSKECEEFYDIIIETKKNAYVNYYNQIKEIVASKIKAEKDRLCEEQIAKGKRKKIIISTVIVVAIVIAVFILMPVIIYADLIALLG